MEKEAKLAVYFNGKVVIGSRSRNEMNLYNMIQNVTISSKLVDLKIRDSKTGKIEIYFSGELEEKKDFKIEAYVVEHELRVSAIFYNDYRNYNGDLKLEIALPRNKMKPLEVNTTFNDLPQEMITGKINLLDIHTKKREVKINLFDSQYVFFPDYTDFYWSSGYMKKEKNCLLEVNIFPERMKGVFANM